MASRRSGSLAFLTAWLVLASAPPAGSTAVRAERMTSWDELVASARQHLAGELDVQPGDLKATRIERMEWGDTSLGCPEPGKAYLPVVTDGFQVTLALDRYEYKVNLSGSTIVTCERSPGARTRKSGRQTSPAMGLFMQASADLARRLGIARGEVRLRGIQPVIWQGESVSCEGRVARPGEPGINGYQFDMSAGKTRYVYRSDESDVLYCGEGGPAD